MKTSERNIRPPRKSSSPAPDHALAALLKYRLKLRGQSFSSVARQIGVTPTFGYMVAARLRPSERVQRALSTAAGLDFARCWGKGRTRGAGKRSTPPELSAAPQSEGETNHA
jgi:hypothetical protein